MKKYTLNYNQPTDSRGRPYPSLWSLKIGTRFSFLGAKTDQVYEVVEKDNSQDFSIVVYLSLKTGVLFPTNKVLKPVVIL